ncbi:MAG: hypothetical protein FWD12_04875, partial [Alphaproteobacteria bacterium]|nr:hypothetical protein [Alphaproteobacteria bacterium]
MRFGSIRARPAQPYTADKTRILLSFANNGGGDLFVDWLRRKLMDVLDYYSANAIYLDNVASRNAPGGVILPDLRDKNRVFNPTAGTTSDGSYVRIGAMNDRWEEMWLKALSEAKVLIQVQTKEYFDSKPCAEEMAKIGAQLKKAKNTLEVLALSFDNDLPGMAMGQSLPRTTPMCLTKVPGTTD